MPLDRLGEYLCFLGEFLGVVFTKVLVRGWRLVEGENVVCGLELGNGD